MLSNLSTLTIQTLVDDANAMGLVPTQNVGGFSKFPALICANDVMNAICAVGFPHKWNQVIIPPFYSNSFQQDYAVVYPAAFINITLSSVASAINGLSVYTGTVTGGDFNGLVGVPFVITGFTNSVNNGTFLCVQSTSTTLVLKNAAATTEAHAATAVNAQGSIMNLAWLERGVAFDINNTSVPKPFTPVECGRQLPQQTATYYTTGIGYGNPGFICNWMPNRNLYYGTWGTVNTATSLGNNPVSGSVYTNPVASGSGTPPRSQPSNPITQIQDANGNLLLLTTYGTEGSTAPLAPVGSQPGTQVSGSGASTVWTVLDPDGWGFRILPAPSQTGVVWQFSLLGQFKPVRFISLAQTLSPLPDEFEPHFRQGFVAQCMRYSPDAKVRAKFREEWTMWLKSLNEMRAKEDRELEEWSFIPDRGIMGSGRQRNNYVGAAWPFNYPRP